MENEIRFTRLEMAHLVTMAIIAGALFGFVAGFFFGTTL